jgi:hypothetical protein
MPKIITLVIRDPKDVLTVADALLKSGYTVSTPKRKVGAKWEAYIVATTGTIEAESQEV